MRLQLSTAYLLLIPLAALLGVFAACGDDDDGGGEPLTMEAYFDRLSTIGAAAEADASAASDAYGEVDPQDSEALVAAYKVFFVAAQSVISESVDQLDSITPPEDLQGEHDAWVEAGNDYVREIGDVEEDVSAVESEDDLNTVFENTPGLDAAAEQFVESCQTLQQAAVDNAIEADLHCEFGE